MSDRHECRPGMRLVDLPATAGTRHHPPFGARTVLVDDGTRNGGTWVCPTCGRGWVRDVDTSWWDPRTRRGVAVFLFDWRRETRRERRRRTRRLPPPPGPPFPLNRTLGHDWLVNDTNWHEPRFTCVACGATEESRRSMAPCDRRYL